MESKEKSKILRKQKIRKILALSIDFILLSSLFVCGLLVGRLIYYTDTEYTYVPGIGEIKEVEDFSIDLFNVYFDEALPFSFTLEVTIEVEAGTEREIVFVYVIYSNHTISFEFRDKFGDLLMVFFIEGTFGIAAGNNGVILHQSTYWHGILFRMDGINGTDISIEQITLYSISSSR